MAAEPTGPGSAEPGEKALPVSTEADVPPVDDGRVPASALDEPVREHLGKQLRSTYHVMTEKPSFLGDPAIPPQFDSLIHKLEKRDRERADAIHGRAVAAVEGALEAALKDK